MDIKEEFCRVSRTTRSSHFYPWRSFSAKLPCSPTISFRSARALKPQSSMDPPVTRSCVRNPHAPSILWECLNRPLGQNRGPNEPNNPPGPILPPRVGMGYLDFSAPCEAAAPQSLPCAERAFQEPDISFQPPAWNVATSEIILPAKLASESGGLKEGSPRPSKYNLLAGNAASDAGNKAVYWRVENAGRWSRCGLAGLIFIQSFN